GFGAPIRAWLVGDLKPMVRELLAPAVVRERGLLDHREVTRLVQQNEAGREDNALRIWALLTLELWLRTFVDPSSDAQRLAGTGASTERPPRVS
ncbi:MAG TPA: asparagine synthase-related protein, partial [Candidatus Thermoplasmatota archaeon]|nr:asparagine synthase-related protein [Candidatus Thermoplasmatota archaeon]